MPINVERVRGAELPRTEANWSADDVILYHLGLGAGAEPVDRRELRYVYERDLVALPSYGVLPAMGALWGMLQLAGMEIDLGQLLHGSQEIELHRPLPVVGRVVTTAKVADVFDKGSGALVVLETLTSDAEGEPLCTNRFHAFIRGEGGFGGESGPPPPEGPPARDPDYVVSCPTLPQQALLYRLSGDKNPLHADPDFAAKAGFERPILHGLCSFGIACKAAVDSALDGDVGRIVSYATRFSGVVFPGETIEVSVWEEGDRLQLAARCVERDAPVLSNGEMGLGQT